MAVAHVASNQGFDIVNTGVFGGNMTHVAGSQTAHTFTYTATGTGNAVLFWVAMIPSGTSPTTCSLSATSWSFTQLGSVINGGSTGGCSALFSAFAPSTSLATITMTWNQPTNSWFNNVIDEFSGTHATTIAAGNNSATGTGTPTVSVTPTATNCMIWTASNDNVTAVGNIAGSAATKGGDDTRNDWSEYRLLSGGSGSSQSCAFTGSGSYIIGAVAIQPPAAGGSANWKKETYWWQRPTESSGVF